MWISDISSNKSNFEKSLVSRQLYGLIIYIKQINTRCVTDSMSGSLPHFSVILIS